MRFAQRNCGVGRRQKRHEDLRMLTHDTSMRCRSWRPERLFTVGLRVEPPVAKYVNRQFSNGLALDISSFGYIMMTSEGVRQVRYSPPYRNTVPALRRALLIARATEIDRSVNTSEGHSESLPTDNESKARNEFDSGDFALVRCGCDSTRVRDNGKRVCSCFPAICESSQKSVGL
jgi:hypothetical protein